MAKIQDLTVKVTLNGALDYDKIAEEVRAAVQREVERVGVSVNVGDKQAQRPTKDDYVKVLEDDGREDVTVGEIRKIVEDDNSDCPFYAKTLNDEYSNWFEEHDVILATDEEVAAAKAELERKELERKWASINRKPNEFKEGDIVRVINSPRALPVGTIFEVKSVGDCGIYDHEGFVYMIPEKQLELIKPVEARFDLSSEGDR